VFAFDHIGLLFYIGILAGCVNGFWADAGEYASLFFYFFAAGDLPGISSFYTFVLVQASLIIGFVLVPRIFAFHYLRDHPEEPPRVYLYYVVRSVTSSVLLCLQVALIIGIGACIG
jgi:hypothetical protein